MQLLQIWAWSRIITLAPIPSSESSTLMPTIIDPDNVLPNPPYAARWSYHISRTHTAHNALRIIRNVLDHYVAKWYDVQSLRVEGPIIQGGLDTVLDYMNWYHQITRVQNSHNILSMNMSGYRPTDTRDWEYVYNRMEQLVIDCENSGDEQQSLRDTRARARRIGREIMNFSSSWYPSVRVRPADTARGNAFGEAGLSSVYAEAGPSTVCTEAGPSSFYLEIGPSTVITLHMLHTCHHLILHLHII
ncbi:UNVERIFIED_CONTAM: hypothetical protein Sindi_1244300 [Sesamum indicum]